MKSREKLERKKALARTNAPWFDKEHKSIKYSPINIDIREKMFFTQGELRYVIKRKKNIYRSSIMDDMHEIGKVNPKRFWKLLNKIYANRDLKVNLPGNIKPSDWASHLKSIFQSEGNCETIGHLCVKITKEEVKMASAIIKHNKAPGIDSIINEMVICILNFYPIKLLSLFNAILKSEDHIPALSVIVPILEKYSLDGPNNYRGIFYSVLNKRLRTFCVEKEMISPSQLGFLPGNPMPISYSIIL